MTTKLDGPLKREIEVDGRLYTLTVTPEGLRLVPKGRRKGLELAWQALLSGEAALAASLNASLERLPPPDNMPSTRRVSRVENGRPARAAQKRSVRQRRARPAGRK